MKKTKKFSIHYRVKKGLIHYEVLSPRGEVQMRGTRSDLPLAELKAIHEKTLLKRLNSPTGHRCWNANPT